MDRPGASPRRSLLLAVVVGGLVATPSTHTAGPSAFATGFWCGPPLEQSTGQVPPSHGRGVHIQHAPLRRRNGLHRGAEPADSGRSASSRGTCGRLRLPHATGAGRSDCPGAAAGWDRRLVPVSSRTGRLLRLRRGGTRAHRGHGCRRSGSTRQGSSTPGVRRVSSRTTPTFRTTSGTCATSSGRSTRRRSSTTTTRSSPTDLTEQGFVANLSAIRRVALESSTPFWFFAQLTELPGLRRASESEKRWQALQALAYGARGVMFFTYWSRVSADFPQPGVIDPRTGLPTGHYPEVRRVNSQVRGFGQQLASAKSTSVFHNGPLAAGAVTRPSRAAVYFPSRAAITVGLFASAGYRYAMLANRDYRSAVSTRAVLSFGARLPERFDLASGRWVRVRPVRLQAHSVTVRLNLVRPPELSSGCGSRCLPVRSGPRRYSAVCGPMSPIGTSWIRMASRTRFEVRPGASALRASGWRALGVGPMASGSACAATSPQDASTSGTSSRARPATTACSPAGSGACRSCIGSPVGGRAG